MPADIPADAPAAVAPSAHRLQPTSSEAAPHPGATLGRTELIAKLSRMMTTGAALQAIFDTTVEGVRAVLDHDACKVLELIPGGHAVKLVSGVGWKPGLIGVATVGTGQDSQAGYTLRTSEPVVVTDLRTEQRFWGPPLLREHGVVSGISAVIPGKLGPWGVFGVHSTRRRAYTEDDPLFVEAIANLLGTAIVRRLIEEEAEGSRGQTVRALRREETRSAELRGIITAMGDGVLVFDELDRLLLMNDAAQAILGERPVGSLADLAALVGLWLGAPDEHALIERPLADSNRWLEVSTFRVAAPGNGYQPIPRGHDNRASTLVVIRDVTDARGRREARDAFVGMLSHELRTPITTVYGGAELLAAEPDHPRRAEIAADVRAEADRLRRMVENLLVLSRVERDALSLVTEPVALPHVLPAIVAAEQVQWPEHPMRLTIPGSVPTVAADPTYLEQALRNFLGNAAKFSPEGSPVDVTVQVEGERVVVAVSDQGPGFDLAERDHLFRLFYRTAAARLKPGSGIGLFVSRRLVELMGGTVTAHAEPGRGATFRLELLVHEADAG
jgi:signal transduction histidine kinase